MPEERIISGLNEDAIWHQVNADFLINPDPLGYHVVLQQESRRVLLDMDIDLGGGFESGSAFTTFSSYLFGRDAFRFAIHREGFLDEIGKFFGMQDVALGFGDFDKRFVVKTNDEAKTIELFSDAELRYTLTSLPDLSFGIVQYLLESTDDKAPFLELRIEDGITDPDILRKAYHSFFSILEKLD